MRQNRAIKQPFSDEEFIELYINQNKTQVQIAEIFGVDRDYIHRYVQRRKIKKPVALLTANRQKTCVEKYGATSYAGSAEGRQRIEQTCFEKYGVKCSLDNKECNAKARQTMIEKYGVPYSAMSDELDRKRQETMILKYGVPYAQQRGHEDTSEVLHSKENFRSYIENLPKKNLTYISNVLGYDPGAISYWVKKHNLEDIIEGADYESEPEREIKELVESWGINTEKNKQIIFPYEIDIYCPEYKVGIEFNGSWWHREEQKGILYHQRKALKSLEAGIQLFQIFDYEWNDENVRKKIIGRLRNIFGLNSQKVYARSCLVKPVSNVEKGKFMEENHIQGNDRASLYYGLYHNGELVACMDFSKPRVNKEARWELTRFACKIDTTVVGGASKLFKHFVTEHPGENIVSYSDLTKTTGNIYKVLGFNRVNLNRPRYMWVKGRTVLSRFQTQVKNEKKLMTDLGFFRVYDAGTYTWIYGDNQCQ